MLQPFITHKFASAVWRLEIDSLANTIVAEIRDSSDKKVSFASLNLATGETYFDGLQTEERWLTGIEAAHNGVLLLHLYESELLPVHKGLIAINAVNGQVLWQNFNYAFDHLTINGPLLYDTRLQPRKLFLTDIKSGAALRNYEPVIDLELVNQLILPELMTDEFTSSLYLPVQPIENTLYSHQHNNLRIVSLHAIAEGTLQQHLYIMNDSGIVYEDLLNDNIQKLQPESFLIYRDQLIYLKDRSQLKVLNL